MAHECMVVIVRLVVPAGLAMREGPQMALQVDLSPAFDDGVGLP